MSLAERNEDWALGFEDEVWWSRLALPMLHAWSIDGEPMRLVRQSVAKDDPDPKAISCYGLYLPEIGDTWLRFVDGRPVSSITTQFLSWCCQELQGDWQESMGVGLGQCQLAHKPRGTPMDRRAQPPSEAE